MILHNVTHTSNLYFVVNISLLKILSVSSENVHHWCRRPDRAPQINQHALKSKQKESPLQFDNWSLLNVQFQLCVVYQQPDSPQGTISFRELDDARTTRVFTGIASQLSNYKPCLWPNMLPVTQHLCSKYISSSTLFWWRWEGLRVRHGLRSFLCWLQRHNNNNCSVLIKDEPWVTKGIKAVLSEKKWAFRGSNREQLRAKEKP